jgi:protein-L-isoaspartate(D-aspartate) O-methyltransferase
MIPKSMSSTPIGDGNRFSDKIMRKTTLHRWLPWGKKAPEPTQDSKEPVLSRDESIDHMEFLLSLRRRGISDAAVLRAIDAVPREKFVLPEFADTAYADQAMPIACGQTISQPYVVAYMTEQLGVKREHRVLEVGTGSGYQAAILSQLAGEVFTVERYRTLAEGARRTLEALGYHNVTVIAGDGLNGVPEHAPYDRIIVTAAAETIPQVLVDELAVGGMLILPLGQHDGPQRLVKLTRGEGGAVTQEDLIWVRFVPLLPGQAREL